MSAHGYSVSSGAPPNKNNNNNSGEPPKNNYEHEEFFGESPNSPPKPKAKGERKKKKTKVGLPSGVIPSSSSKFADYLDVEETKPEDDSDLAMVVRPDHSITRDDEPSALMKRVMANKALALQAQRDAAIAFEGVARSNNELVAIDGRLAEVTRGIDHTTNLIETGVSFLNDAWTAGSRELDEQHNNEMEQRRAVMNERQTHFHREEASHQKWQKERDTHMKEREEFYRQREARMEARLAAMEERFNTMSMLAPANQSAGVPPINQTKSIGAPPKNTPSISVPPKSNQFIGVPPKSNPFIGAPPKKHTQQLDASSPNSILPANEGLAKSTHAFGRGPPVTTQPTKEQTMAQIAVAIEDIEDTDC